jgi:hypothetical protein
VTRGAVFALLYLASAAVCCAQSVATVKSDFPELSLDALNSGEGVVLIHAGTDKKVASLRIKKRNFGASPWSWDATFQAPYDKENDPAIIGDFDGLSTSTNLAFGVQRISIVNQPVSAALEAEQAMLCKKYGDTAGLGCTDEDIRQLVIDGKDPLKACAKLSKAACIAQASKIASQFVEDEIEIFERLEALGRLKPLRAWIFGINGKIGVEQFKFLDGETFVEQKANRSPWSVNAHIYYKVGPNTFGGGIMYQDSYKAQKEVSVCTPATTVPATSVCTSGRLGAPMRKTREIIFLQLNHHRRGNLYAIAPRISHDFDTNETGFSLPVYLVRNKKGDFTGGVQLSWQSESDEVVAGFFVGKAFAYF